MYSSIHRHDISSFRFNYINIPTRCSNLVLGSSGLEVSHYHYKLSCVVVIPFLSSVDELSVLVYFSLYLLVHRLVSVGSFSRT